VFPVASAFNHLLEYRSPIIAGGGAGLDELRHDIVAFGPAPGIELAALIGNGKVMLRLAPGGHPHVERGT
jgi:hypothetical protein